MLPRAIAVLPLLSLAVPAGHAAGPDIRVTTRVYDNARLAPQSTGAALDAATRTFRMASIALQWIRCDIAPDACSQPPPAGELVLRVTVGPATSETSPRVALGDAFVDPARRDGVLATIYVDRVTRLARDWGVDEPTLMGRAIAHELGHLLLGTSAHSNHGLMRAQWSSADIRRNSLADWVFTRPEAVAMRRRLGAQW